MRTMVRWAPVLMIAVSLLQPSLVRAQTGALTPRPEFNGLRVKLPNRHEIYVVDQGRRRWIPNPETYNNLFRGLDGIIVDLGVAQIPLGPNVTSGAILAYGIGTGEIYLVDQGVKRHIASPAIMDQYHFAWNRVQGVPAVLLDFIPTGPTIRD